MTRKATPKASSLAKAMTALRLIKADPLLAKKNPIRQIDDQVTSEWFPIGQFLTIIRNIEPIEVQRNDLYRLNNGLAKHLEDFQLPQAAVALVYLNGKYYLVDGNTRKRKWLSGENVALPSKVCVFLMMVDSLDEGKAIYRCYDSKTAKKTVRDDLVSMLHDAGVVPETLKSKLLAGGKIVGVVRNMARVASGGSCTVTRMQEVVSSHSSAFRYVDALNLDEGTIPAAGVWALARLYKEVPQAFSSYIDKYAMELRKMGTDIEHTAAPAVLQAVDKAHRNCRKYQKLSATSKVPVMFPAYLEGFVVFCQQLARAKQASPSFVKALPAIKTQITQEISNAARLLPTVTAKAA